MEYRRLGKWGVRLSELGLGSWLTLGGHVEGKESIRILQAAYDRGITYFDTADTCGGAGDTVSVHGHGEAEALLGEALSGYPRTKAAFRS